MRLPNPLAETWRNPEENAALPRRGARRPFNQLLACYALTDALALLFGFFLSWELATVVNSMFFDRSLFLLSRYDNAYFVKFLLIATGVLLWFQHTGHYRVRMPFWLEVKNITGTLGFAMIADGFLQFASKQDFSRLWLMSCWLFAALGAIAMRSAMRSHLRHRGLWQVPTLLIGAGPTADDTRAALKSETSLGYEITAQIKNLPVVFLQEGRSWEKLCRAYGAEYVVIALDGLELAHAEQPIAQLMRESVPFSVSPPRRNMPVLDMTPQYFFNHDVKLLTRDPGLDQLLPCFTKRIFDVLCAGLALLALAPILLVATLLVKLDGGPAFFGHKRIGKNGRVFSCLKFRSMVTNGEKALKDHLASHPEARAEWEATRKLKDDPRVTRLGKFLRSSSLDELPQLINVLRGDMSLVGPRPIVTDEVPRYESDIAYYYRVTPGITGLWQVSGRNDVNYRERVRMDCWYVRNWSLWHDIAIICKTFPALLQRRGAY